MLGPGLGADSVAAGENCRQIIGALLVLAFMFVAYGMLWLHRQSGADRQCGG